MFEGDRHRRIDWNHSLMQEVMDSANKKVQERMKGPYNCSKLFGTWCRPKTVTLSSYNTLIKEKHKNMCVVNEIWIFFKEIFIIFSVITVHFSHGQYIGLLSWAEASERFLEFSAELDTGITNTELTLHVWERSLIRKKSLSSFSFEDNTMTSVLRSHFSSVKKIKYFFFLTSIF